MTKSSYHWGIDLGGTKIEGVVLERPANKVISRHRIATEQKGGYKHILDRIVALTKELQKLSGLKPDKLGIGTPGAIDRKSGLLKNSNTLCLNGNPVNTDLADLISLPVSIANDANCFALAEALMGAGSKYKSSAETIFGVIMGTGVGSGIVVRGKLITGSHGIAGEWGHFFLDKSGGKCYCGRVGCTETIISGPSLEKYYERLSGKHLPLKQIVKLYKTKSDAEAILTIDRLIHFFGKGIAVIINVLDPDIIILGGGLGNIEVLYDEGVIEVAKHIFNKELNTPFLKPLLGDSAGVFGAALLTESA